MKKVIVRLGNGLGNQLFTYAAAYCFAKKNNADLYVDDESGFYKRYKYELHNFNITAPIIETKYSGPLPEPKITLNYLFELVFCKIRKIFIF